MLIDIVPEANGSLCTSFNKQPKCDLSDDSTQIIDYEINWAHPFWIAVLTQNRQKLPFRMILQYFRIISRRGPRYRTFRRGLRTSKVSDLRRFITEVSSDNRPIFD